MDNVTRGKTEFYEKLVERSEPHELWEILDRLSGDDWVDLKLAIQTYIALGGPLGKSLEEVFPEYMNANPEHLNDKNNSHEVLLENEN